MYSITLEQLREKHACADGYNKLVSTINNIQYKQQRSYIGCNYTHHISVKYILESNGIGDALWVMGVIDDASADIKMFGLYCVALGKPYYRREIVELLEKIDSGISTQDMKAEIVRLKKSSSGAEYQILSIICNIVNWGMIRYDAIDIIANFINKKREIGFLKTKNIVKKSLNRDTSDKAHMIDVFALMITKQAWVKND